MKKYFKKRYIIGGFVCILLLLVVFLLVGKPKTGSYMLMSNDTNHLMYRGIRLNMEDGTFELVGSPLDSVSAYMGTFVTEGNKLIATEENSDVTYVFDIQNRMMLKFNREESVGWEQGVMKTKLSGMDGGAYYIYLSEFWGRMIYK